MNIIDWAFGRKSVQERLRANQRSLERAIRELDRERSKLEVQEKKLIGDIKRSAQAHQVGACRIMARDLVRTRRYIHKFYGMRTHLQGVSLRIQSVRSNEQLMTSMRGAAKLLGGMNRGMNLPGVQRIAMEFERQSDMMDERQEMMDEAVDGIDDEDEEESEDVVNQVFEEIGIVFGQEFGTVPDGVGDEIQTRVDSLCDRTR